MKNIKGFLKSYQEYLVTFFIIFLVTLIYVSVFISTTQNTLFYLYTSSFLIMLSNGLNIFFITKNRYLFIATSLGLTRKTMFKKVLFKSILSIILILFAGMLYILFSNLNYNINILKTLNYFVVINIVLIAYMVYILSLICARLKLHPLISLVINVLIIMLYIVLIYLVHIKLIISFIGLLLINIILTVVFQYRIYHLKIDEH